MLSYNCKHESIACGFHFPKLQNYMKHMPESSKLGIYIMDDYFVTHVVYFTCLQKTNQICTWYKVHLLQVDERVDFTSMPPYIPIDSMVCLPQTDFCHIVRAHMAVPCTTSNGPTLQISTKIEHDSNICTFVTDADDTVETVVGFASGVDGSLDALKQRMQDQVENEENEKEKETPMFVDEVAAQTQSAVASSSSASAADADNKFDYVEVCIPGSGSAVYLRCYHRESANKCLYPLKPICTFLKFANMSNIVEMFLQNSKDFPLFLRLSVGLMGFFTITIPPIGTDVETDFEPNLSTERLPPSISTSMLESSTTNPSLPQNLAVGATAVTGSGSAVPFKRIAKKPISTAETAQGSKKRKSTNDTVTERQPKKTMITSNNKACVRNKDDDDDKEEEEKRKKREFDREVDELLDNPVEDFFK